MKKSIVTLTAIALTAIAFIACASNTLPQQQLSSEEKEVTRLQQQLPPNNIKSETEVQKQSQQVSHQYSQQQLSSEEEEILRLQHKLRLDSIKNEVEIQRLKNERKLEVQKALNAAIPKIEPGTISIFLKCGKQSFDGDGYMAGHGVSLPKAMKRDAELEANQVALADMATRFMGVLINAADYYNKNGEVPSNKRFNQNELEAGVRIIGEKIINKYARRVCLEYEQNKNGAYLAYQAVNIPLRDVLENVATNSEITKLDIDKDKYMDAVKKELESIRERQQQELNAIQEAGF
jgi:hypothetical protein